MGSAIIGFPLESDATKIHVYYEGNRAGAPSMLRFADRAKHAAGRCRWRRLDVDQWRRDNPGEPLPRAEYGYVGYPTAAQATVSADDLVEVGSYDDWHGVVSLAGPGDAALLAAWIGSTESSEYLATGAEFELRRHGQNRSDKSGL